MRIKQLLLVGREDAANILQLLGAVLLPDLLQLRPLCVRKRYAECAAARARHAWRIAVESGWDSGAAPCAMALDARAPETSAATATAATIVRMRINSPLQHEDVIAPVIMVTQRAHELLRRIRPCRATWCRIVPPDLGGSAPRAPEIPFIGFRPSVDQGRPGPRKATRPLH